MNNSDRLVLEYVCPISYDNGTLSVEDDTVIEFQDQDEQVIIRTACAVPGVKRGWLGSLTVTKEYTKLMDFTEKVKVNEVLSNMLCVRVNTHVGNDMSPVIEYVFLKY